MATDIGNAVEARHMKDWWEKQVKVTPFEAGFSAISADHALGCHRLNGDFSAC
jgi:hypothetical protein